MTTNQTATKPQGRTRRSPDAGYAGCGAVGQHDGALPIYVCNTCGRQVVWATSAKTGRKYLVNVSRGYLDQRYYRGNSIHRCEQEMDRQAEASARRERTDLIREAASLYPDFRTERDAHMAALQRVVDADNQGLDALRAVVEDLRRQAR